MALRDGMSPFDLLLAIKREKMGVNQVLALIAIKRRVVCRVSDVMRDIESNINVTSQLMARLHDEKLVMPTLIGKVVHYQLTAKGHEKIKRIIP